MAHPRRTAAILAAVLLTLTGGRGMPATAGPGSAHPYFDDRGTLPWFRAFEEARGAARAQGKLLFIEFGRRECRNCRVLVQTILPAEGLRERMASLCVGFAAECDEPDPRVDALFARHLPGASALPFVAFTTPDLEWVTGWAGLAGADVLDQHLRAAEARRPACPARAVPSATSPALPAAVEVVVAARPLPSPPASASTRGPVPVPPSAPVRAERAPAPSARPVEAPPRVLLAPSAPAPTSRAMPAADLLPRARAASAAGRHGEALGLWAVARHRTDAGSADAWAPVVARADVWAEDALRAAVLAARERRWGDAAERLAAVRREASDRPAARDAAVGERAIERLRGVGPGGAAEPLRAATASEFHGTRWSRLFTP